jgi:hypothetical protein
MGASCCCGYWSTVVSILRHGDLTLLIAGKNEGFHTLVTFCYKVRLIVYNRMRKEARVFFEGWDVYAA